MVVLVVAVSMVVALSGKASAHGPSNSNHKVEVVAAFYPVAYAVERVGGRFVNVTNLTPVGAEPHDVELTPEERDQIEDARVVFVMGNGFQPAVEKAARARQRGTVELLKTLPI